MAKVTILPAGQALGVTEQLPEVERHLYPESYLTDAGGAPGGRAAELLVLGEASTGASNDLAGATQLATRMVREWGCPPGSGPIGYPEGGSAFLGSGGRPVQPYAEATQAAIDDEVARLLREAEQPAVTLIRANRGKLNQLADLLQEKETVDGAEVYRLLGIPEPEHRPDGQDIAPARVGTPAHAAASTTVALPPDYAARALAATAR